MDLLHQDITDKIIKAFYNTYNTLGYGFLEKVYENSLSIELRKFGLYVEKQKHITVFYDRIEVGLYYADIIVNDIIILELKATESIALEHEYQLTNYLKATNKEVGLLLNYGKKSEFKRKIFLNENKKLN